MRAYFFIFTVLLIAGTEATPFRLIRRRIIRAADINSAPPQGHPPGQQPPGQPPQPQNGAPPQPGQQPPGQPSQAQNGTTPRPGTGQSTQPYGSSQPTGSNPPNGLHPNETRPTGPPPTAGPSQPSNTQPSMPMNGQTSSSPQPQTPTTPNGPSPPTNGNNPSGQPSPPAGQTSSSGPTNFAEQAMKADFEKTDTNHNGGISKEELKASMDAHLKELSAKMSSMVDEHFPSFDTNKNNELDIKETMASEQTFSESFMEVILEEDANVTIDLPKSFNEADTNKNGGVTFDELKNYIRNLFKDKKPIDSQGESQLNSLEINFNQADTDHTHELSLKEVEAKPQGEQLVKGIIDMMKKSAEKPAN
uniref:EF-hand domain-containing protein n=1 Tax=Plectus sambesii TaxID=2011161 RepID=A0A914VEA7_9BILA